jgi:hypothetical protein
LRELIIQAFFAKTIVNHQLSYKEVAKLFAILLIALKFLMGSKIKIAIWDTQKAQEEGIPLRL